MGTWTVSESFYHTCFLRFFNCSLCRFGHLAAVELLTPRTGDSNSSDEELDANNIKFFETHGAEGSTDSKEDLTLDKAEKRNARSKHCISIIPCLKKLVSRHYSPN